MAPLYACAKILISTRGLLEAYHNSKSGLLEAYHNSESGLLEAYHNRKRGLLEAPYISKSGLLEAPLDACAKILTLFVLSPTIASARACARTCAPAGGRTHPLVRSAASPLHHVDCVVRVCARVFACACLRAHVCALA